MKKIYELPEVTVFEVGVPEQMIAESRGYSTSQNTYDSGILGNDANSNSMDDQSTPWYRR